jgi:hypothetical protein
MFLKSKASGIFTGAKIQLIAGKGNRTFVIISDALRYEVAVELMEYLNRNTKGKGTMETRQSILPSVTAFGMAELLPGKLITVKKNEKNRKVLVDAQGTTDSKSWEAMLQATNPSSVVCTYRDLFKVKQQRRELVAGQEVFYTYHNATDSMDYKKPSESKVFVACKTAVEAIDSIVRIITDELSGVIIFIAADHGFLYTYNSC